jgi:2-keto-4-pentenoate hydratase/2-oxohepta-3-ene-1,7-dioic acid hydratase in catechol pathway
MLDMEWWNRIVLKGSGIALGLVRLQPPIPRPSGAIMCVGKNYLDHVKEVDTWKVAPGIAAPDVPKVSQFFFLSQGIAFRVLLFISPKLLPFVRFLV